MVGGTETEAAAMGGGGGGGGRRGVGRGGVTRGRQEDQHQEQKNPSGGKSDVYGWSEGEGRLMTRQCGGDTRKTWRGGMRRNVALNERRSCGAARGASQEEE